MGRVISFTKTFTDYKGEVTSVYRYLFLRESFIGISATTFNKGPDYKAIYIQGINEPVEVDQTVEEILAELGSDETTI